MLEVFLDMNAPAGLLQSVQYPCRWPNLKVLNRYGVPLWATELKESDAMGQCFLKLDELMGSIFKDVNNDISGITCRGKIGCTSMSRGRNEIGQLFQWESSEVYDETRLKKPSTSKMRRYGVSGQ